MKKSISAKKDDGKRQKQGIRESFSGKNLTSFGGSGLIRRFFKRHKIRAGLDDRLSIEGRRKSKYSAGAVFVSCLYGMFLGFPRPHQMRILTADKVFQQVTGLVAFPVQSTISRFLSSLKVAVAKDMASFHFDFLMKFRKRFKQWQNLTLDLDSHVTTVYGHQQRAGLGYNPKKKGRKSYDALLCFVGETRDYLGGLLRSGKHHTSYQAVSFLKAMIKRLPCHIEHLRLRADSGFFSREMIEFLQSRRVEFYIVVPLQEWVQRKIRHIREWKGLGGGVETAECEYIVTKKLTLRMVVIRKVVQRGRSPRKQLQLLHTDNTLYDYQVIASNSEKPPEEVWRFYNQRACCENFIKEGVYGFGLDKVVSHSWAGNRAWFELLMLGYNLMNFFKEEALNQKAKKNTIQTIRTQLFLIPGKLISTSRERFLRLADTWAYRKEYQEALAKIC